MSHGEPANSRLGGNMMIRDNTSIHTTLEHRNKNYHFKVTFTKALAKSCTGGEGLLNLSAKIMWASSV